MVCEKNGLINIAGMGSVGGILFIGSIILEAYPSRLAKGVGISLAFRKVSPSRLIVYLFFWFFLGVFAERLESKHCRAKKEI